MGRSPVVVCTYCRAQVATTEDHAIPHCLFPKTHHNIPLPKAPACSRCQTSYSKDEDYFRAAVIAGTPARNECGTEQVYQTTVRCFDRNLRLKREFEAEVSRVGVVGDAGLVVKTQHEPDERRLLRVFSKVVRGLYWYHTKQLMPKYARALRALKYTELTPLSGPKDRAFTVFRESKKTPLRELGDGTAPWVRYSWAELTTGGGRGVWFFQFHGAPTWLVFVGMKEQKVAPETNPKARIRTMQSAQRKARRKNRRG